MVAGRLAVTVGGVGGGGRQRKSFCIVDQQGAALVQGNFYLFYLYVFLLRCMVFSCTGSTPAASLFPSAEKSLKLLGCF